jgi:hypothetical protein
MYTRQNVISFIKHTWRVQIEVHGGSLYFDSKCIRALISGQGLNAGGNKWDGTISIEQEFSPITLKGLGVKPFTDTVNLRVPLITQIAVSDSFTPITLKSLAVGEYTEQIEWNKDIVSLVLWTDIALTTWSDLADNYYWR